MNLCPFCGEEIRDQATSCRHCNRSLHSSAMKQSQGYTNRICGGCGILLTEIDPKCFMCGWDDSMPVGQRPDRGSSAASPKYSIPKFRDDRPLSPMEKASRQSNMIRFLIMLIVLGGAVFFFLYLEGII